MGKSLKGTQTEKNLLKLLGESKHVLDMNFAKVAKEKLENCRHFYRNCIARKSMQKIKFLEGMVEITAPYPQE